MIYTGTAVLVPGLLYYSSIISVQKTEVLLFCRTMREDTCNVG